MNALPTLCTNTDAPGATYLKFKDDRWSVKDGTPLPDGPLLAVKTKRTIKRWLRQKPVETYDEASDGSLPDVDELNKTIPTAEWELGIEGKPRSPYQLEHSAHLVHVATGRRYIFASATYGAKITILALRESTQWVSAIRGPVLPVVQLISADMRTGYGMRRRPELHVVGWQGFGIGEDVPAVPRLSPVKPPSLAEEMADDFGDAA